MTFGTPCRTSRSNVQRHIPTETEYLTVDTSKIVVEILVFKVRHTIELRTWSQKRNIGKLEKMSNKIEIEKVKIGNSEIKKSGDVDCDKITKWIIGI